MHIPPMRPTFELRVPMTPGSTLTHLRDLLDRDEHPIRGSGVGHHLLLTVAERDRHLWSPWLSIEVHADDARPGDENTGATHRSATRIEGRFSPSPALWTGFMMIWIALGTLAFFVIIFALAQWTMDQPPSALILFALLAPLALALYWVSQVGQRLAHSQMQGLYDTLTDALREALTKNPESATAPPA